MSEQHAFPGKTVNAVIAMKVACNNFADEIPELSKARTNYTPAFAAGFTTRIDTISASYLGVHTRDELFRATYTLSTLTRPVLDDLATVKRNVDIDFKKDEIKHAEILSKLGFNGITVTKLNQAQLVAQLTTFKRNVTPELLAQITAKGMPAEYPNRIVDNADAIIDANIKQEQLKSTSKEATDTIIKELNALYSDIMDFCGIASNYFKRNPLKKEKFTFSKLMQNLGETHKASKKKDAAKPSK